MNTSATIRPNAMQELRERHLSSGSELPFDNWLAYTMDFDEEFYKWLFPEATNIQSFAKGSTKEQLDAFCTWWNENIN